MNPRSRTVSILLLVALLQCCQQFTSAKSVPSNPMPLQFDDSSNPEDFESADEELSDRADVESGMNAAATGALPFDQIVGRPNEKVARSMADGEEDALSGKDMRNNDEIDGSTEFDSNVEPHGLDTNIENARISVTPNDMSTAAGHHHHHHHYVHGWLEMGAHTGKKGAFGWHDKHPVGGKGRR